MRSSHRLMTLQRASWVLLSTDVLPQATLALSRFSGNSSESHFTTGVVRDKFAWATNGPGCRVLADLDGCLEHHKSASERETK